MQPLGALPLDGIAGVFADIDDTLTWQGALVPAAYAAICDGAAAGLRILLATGRPAGWADVLAALFPVAAVVAENGGYAVLRGGERRYWDPAGVRLEQRRRLAALADEATATLPFAHLTADNDLRRVDLAFDLHEHQRLDEGQVGALTRLITAHGARHLRSSIHLHAFHGDHDKAAMLVRLAGELWGEGEEAVKARYLFVGDSPNDQAGFAFFPRSVGVANVARHAAALSPPPAYVTPSPGGQGFAELMAAVLRRG